MPVFVPASTMVITGCYAGDNFKCGARADVLRGYGRT